MDHGHQPEETLSVYIIIDDDVYDPRAPVGVSLITWTPHMLMLDDTIMPEKPLWALL